jgi:uncharacterized protein YbaR (Trm112 family)
LLVITGLDPVIHRLRKTLAKLMDARIKSGHDETGLICDPDSPHDRIAPLPVSDECAKGSADQAGDPRMTSPPERPAGTVDPKLLEILVCPMTKGPLEFDAAKQELISRSAKLAYPIRDGIPIMLPEEARKIE